MFVWLAVPVEGVGVRSFGGHGRAQPSLRGAGGWYHSLEQRLEGLVAAQDGQSYTSAILSALQALPSLSTGKLSQDRFFFLC